MPFFKRINDELMQTPNFVVGLGFELRVETHTEHVYPVDGWYWFDTLDDALSSPVFRTQIVEVTMRQARRALLQVGLYDAVNAAIEALPEPQRTSAKIDWEYSQVVQRHNDFVSTIAPSLGLTEVQLDDLFELAITL